MAVSLTREELYELLWREPQTKLAKEFEVSDSAIGKVARKAGIPRPGPGYWQKLKHGKKVVPVPLPKRFPGASDWIHFGSKWRQDPVLTDENGIPIEPEFTESIDDVRERVIEMVCKVSYPSFARATHSIAKKLLDQDAERERELEKNRYAWPEPKFTSAIDRRRLRLFNALFLKMQSLGCLPYMSTGKYDEYNEASFRIGDQCIHVKIETKEAKCQSGKKARMKPHLELAFKSYDADDNEYHVWKDKEALKLEKQLRDVVIQLIVSAEQKYRSDLQWRFQWSIKEREKRLEEERKQKIEAERLAIELAEKAEKDKIDKLLSQADAMRRADKIREYVETVLERADQINHPIDQIVQWAVWARKQADKIDPLKSNFTIDEPTL